MTGKKEMKIMYDIGIIGGGTAGMTAAIYGQRAGKRTIIIEGGTFGGQITSSPNVENYPGIASVSGSEFSMNLLDQAMKLGAETQMAQVTGIRDEVYGNICSLRLCKAPKGQAQADC